MAPWSRVAAVAVLLVCSGPVPAADERPGPREKCPVCGMFVAKYPDWQAVLHFADGSRAVFDGAKDLFKFLLEPGQYLPSRRREHVVSLFVTDYYSLSLIEARTAWFVLGSDVYGPMGRELVPFAKRAEAEEFRLDHHGSAILAFGEVTAEILGGLDR
jgi:nitrous oxide reductase accessory protein NosL